MQKAIRNIIFLFAVSLITNQVRAQPAPKHNLHFSRLSTVWDEAIPLGNGVIGALIWQKENKLRFSLDRSDLWDLRPTKGLDRPEFKYSWVREQLNSNNYKKVQEYFDEPYDKAPAPSKIPAGALELKFSGKSTELSVHLSLEKAVCEVLYDNGMRLQSFVHATDPVGWFKFDNVKGTEIVPSIVAPLYQSETKKVLSDPVSGSDLSRLGYKQGVVTNSGNKIVYHQKGWGAFFYEVAVEWKTNPDKSVEGVWSVSTSAESVTASEITTKALATGYQSFLQSHLDWWKKYWSKSTIRIPDDLLEKQWYLSQYKFGALARKNAPPISLQGVWTADNGKLPPWKGDYHHDLNTQLSYWPAYTANHLDEAMGYLNHLDGNRENYKRFTKEYFGAEGLNVPGVTTLDGTEMGGWIQYSLSPTTGAWLAHHYYLQWRYSMDRDFLKNRAYPWFKETCIFLEQITQKNEKGMRQLPLSSSPEYNDNKPEAWFTKNTNYDLALMKFAFLKAAELAKELNLTKDADRWQKIYGEFDAFDVNENDGLTIAPGQDYDNSHRHLSHIMAIHPLGLIKWEDGKESQKVITNSIDKIIAMGTDNWVGYSFAWYAGLEARAKNGDVAQQILDVFAKAFCSKNGFHLNGDQSDMGFSKLTYRPFTLEGNFAFASSLQDLLIQSYAGFIEVLPAVPPSWQTLSFQNLRAEGAFLVSAERQYGQLKSIVIKSEKGGKTKLKIPAGGKWNISKATGIKAGTQTGDLLELHCTPGGTATFTFNQ